MTIRSDAAHFQPRFLKADLAVPTSLPERLPYNRTGHGLQGIDNHGWQAAKAKKIHLDRKSRENVSKQLADMKK